MDAAVASGFTRRSYTVAGPTGQPVQASIAFDGATAVVEVANTCGLALLPGGRLEPLDASSRGFGEAVLFALSLNPARIVLALGGSASTDGGMGMLTALGYSFRDADGRQLHGSGRSLAQIHSIHRTSVPGTGRHRTHRRQRRPQPAARCPGRTGGLRAPKGRRTRGRSRRSTHGLDAFRAPRWPTPGSPTPRRWRNTRAPAAPAGSATPACCWGPQQVSGADYFLDLLDFNTRKDSCDVVITGEGSIDEQTLAGKLPAAVARRSGARPIIAVAGRSLLPRERWSEMALTRVYTLAEYTDQDSSKDPDSVRRAAPADRPGHRRQPA